MSSLLPRIMEQKMRALGLLCLMWMWMMGVPMAQEQCSVGKGTYMELKIRTMRNASGHSRVTVRMQRHNAAGATTVSLPPPPSEVTVRRGDCDGDAVGSFLELEFTEEPQSPSGYEMFAGVGRFKMHEEGGTWWEARAVCETEGAHLAVLNSEEEAQALAHLFQRAPSPSGLSDANHAFIGFHDFYTEGQFVTIFGESLNKTGFLRWSGASQPDNHGFDVNPDSDCGGIHRNGGLNDLPCNWKCIFFCEKPLT